MTSDYTPVEQLARELRKRLLPAHYGRSTAKTAYGLLGEVKREILAEPKLYDQTSLAAEAPLGASCGTAFCRAGWVVALKGKLTAWEGIIFPNTLPSQMIGGRTSSPRGGSPGEENIWNYAQRVLGLTFAQADELFGGSEVPGVPGSQSHARKGAAGIERFRRKYAKQLRATKV